MLSWEKATMLVVCFTLFFHNFRLFEVMKRDDMELVLFFFFSGTFVLLLNIKKKSV